MKKRYIEWVHDYFKIDPQLKIGVVFNTTDTNTTHTFNLTLGTGRTQKMQLNNIDPDTAVFMVAEKYSGESYYKKEIEMQRILDYKNITLDKKGMEYFIDIIQLLTEMNIEYEEFDIQQLQRNLRGKSLNCLTDPIIWTDCCNDRPYYRIVLLPNELKIGDKDIIESSNNLYKLWKNIATPTLLSVKENIKLTQDAIEMYDFYIKTKDTEIYRGTGYFNMVFNIKSEKKIIKQYKKIIPINLRANENETKLELCVYNIGKKNRKILGGVIYNLIQCNTLEEIEYICENVENLYNKMKVLSVI